MVENPLNENQELLPLKGFQESLEHQPNSHVKVDIENTMHSEYDPEGVEKDDWKKLWRIKNQEWSSLGFLAFSLFLTAIGYIGDIYSTIIYFLAPQLPASRRSQRSLNPLSL